MESAIRTFGLSKRYGRSAALDGVDLDVPCGVVFGYLGPNGAGKTTTIRLLTGLLRPSAGHTTVFGLDAWQARDDVHRRIGYLPGEFVAYPDMTAEEYLRYLADLRGGVSWSDALLLAKRLDLDLGRRIGTLSHGNRQKVGLVQAFMHRPELLVLDEPTTGLDPLMQREFLALVREARDEGRTVLLSSHILDEVESVADVVGILRAGRLIVVEAVEALKAKALRRIDLTFTGTVPLDELARLPGVREVRAFGATAHLTVEGSTDELFRLAAPHGIGNVVSHEAELEEIFLALYDRPEEA
jgi:ABC-2 type transport system ATP-binding protein